MVREETLGLLLKELRMSNMAMRVEELAEIGREKSWSYEKWLAMMCEEEIAARYRKKVARYKKESKLPSGKTLVTFDFKSAKSVNKELIIALAENKSWLEKTENVIMFGPSGVGKSHLAAAIGHGQVDEGTRCLYSTTTAMVQKLQLSQRELRILGFTHNYLRMP